MQNTPHLPLLLAMEEQFNQGKPEQALNLWLEAGSPTTRETLFMVGRARQEQEDHAAAKACLLASLELDPDYPPAQRQLAHLAFITLDYATAAEWARRYQEYRPYSADALNWRIYALKECGRLEEADEALLAYARTFPYVETTARCAMLIADERRQNVFSLLMAGRLPADKWHRSFFGQLAASAWYNLGVLPMMRHTLEFVYPGISPDEEPDYAGSLGNMAELAHDPHTSVDWYVRAREAGGSAELLWQNEALTRWAIGDFAGGNIAYRNRPASSKHLYLPGLPEWRGEDLSGKRLLVHSEQGIGDVIQFIRYMPYLRERTETVLFNTYRDVLALLRTDANTERVEDLIEDDVLSQIDYQICMMDVPGYLRANGIADFPPDTPYLFPNRDKIEAWRKKLDAFAGLKIGLVWAGNPKHQNDANRSASLVEWRALADIAGVTWFSLQKGNGEPEAAYPPYGLDIHDLGKDIVDLSDTAAILANLDLLISVDTSVTHLAGACGFPCWTLLPQKCQDWRWASQGEVPQWYPSMRLFVRPDTEDWNAFIRRQILPKLLALGATLRDKPRPPPTDADRIRESFKHQPIAETLALCEQALAKAPEDPRLCLICAEVAAAAGDQTRSLELLKTVLKAQPRNLDAHRLSIPLVAKNDLLGASMHLQALLAIDGSNPVVLREAARFYLTHHAPLLAYLIMRHLASESDSSLNLPALALSLLRLGNAQAAAALVADIDLQESDDQSFLYELLYVYTNLDMKSKAHQLKARIVQLFPDADDTNLLIGTALLRWGDPAGWAYYNRCHWSEPTEAPLSVPAWRGENLVDKHLLIYQDQGYGDVIQFFPLLSRHPPTQKITFSVFGELHELLTQQPAPPNVEFITHKELQSRPVNYDYRIGFMHWVADMAPDLNVPPAGFPYLTARPTERLQKWKEATAQDPHLKVGALWAGNPRHFNDYNRSTSLSDWLPIAGVANVALYNLQRDEPSNQAIEFPQFDLRNIVADCGSLSDTAYAITLLDLVIAVDTGPAHLAAALGVETWILLPAISTDFRWQTGRDDCPWYPSVRLFRQQAGETWAQVLMRVAAALAERAQLKGQ